ncbi:MAG: hypothetical protein CL910_20920 [Deltaproteobacteria bacterium]|nr:hypothetical protein [Deltaproteobacteria bacterium]
MFVPPPGTEAPSDTERRVPRRPGGEPPTTTTLPRPPGKERPSQRIDPGGASLLGGPSPGRPEAGSAPRPPAAETAEPGQIVVLHADMPSAIRFARDEAKRLKVRVREPLGSLGLVLSVFLVREGSASEALDELRSRYPELAIALNHRYALGGGRSYGAELVKWGPAPEACGRGLEIGVLDTLPDPSHPALAGARLELRSVLPAGQDAAPRDHATAIAGLLVGRHESGFPGLLPGARLSVAGAFRKSDAGTVDAAMDRLVAGLDWLLGRDVDVINFSFVGPANVVFSQVIQLAAERGVGLVGAVGNEGADAEPGFPAQLDAVLAVTAVDASGKIYRWANRGAQVELAAPGVDLWVPRPGRKGHYVSGTSYAAPFAAAALAVAREKRGAEPARNWLLARTRDLGATGPDATFGEGLLQMDGARPCGGA